MPLKPLSSIRMGWPVLSAGAWKVLVSIVALFVAALVATEVWYAPRTLAPGAAGTLGMQYQEQARFGRTRYVIDEIAAGSPMRDAGAQVGDVWIPDRAYDASRRLEAREPIGLTLIRGDSSRHVIVETRPASTPAAVGAYALTWLVSLLTLATGLLVAFRRPDSTAVRGFSLFLILGTAFNGFQSYLILPAGTAFLLHHLCWPVGRLLATIMFAVFAFNFPVDQPRDTRLKRWLLRYALPAYSLLWLSGAMASTASAAGYWLPLSRPLFAVLITVLAVMVIAILWHNWRTSTGELRERHLWLLLSWTLLLSVQPLVAAVAVRSPGPEDTMIVRTIARAIALVSLLIFAYAILRHRVMSIGFAVNRVVVYSAASIGMLLSFGIIEWLAHHFLEFTGRRQSALLDGAIALGVFLVFHRMRHAGEKLIERLFFHAWQVKEEALRTFVREAAFITRPKALLDAFVGALERFTGGAGYALYRRTPQGDYDRVTATLAEAPEHVDADEPLAVRLRASQAPTYLHDVQSSLPGELALPSVHHGQLDGIVVLGTKPSGETYRPDEREVLGHAAHQIGLDFRALRMEQLEHDVAALKARLKGSLGAGSRGAVGRRPAWRDDVRRGAHQ